MTRRLIITADDFGMSLEVNEAVEAAHRDGILTCASLVVAGRAAEDAIRRAKKLPSLGVGLHLALYGAPAQSAAEPGSRIAPDGVMLGEKPISTGTAIMLSSRVRAQARREIEAQFDAYRRSGLPLGHLDGHWHCHQHPAVLAMALELGPPLGLRAVRVPYESYAASRAAGGGKHFHRWAESVSHYPLAVGMRRQIRAAGLRSNDWFFGKTDAGAIDTDVLAGIITVLPAGVSEIGLHPALSRWRGPDAPPAHWRAEEEVRALTDPRLRALIASSAIDLCRWSDLP
jgi:hopanoid biosynthesis associated protein HpnK